MIPAVLIAVVASALVAVAGPVLGWRLPPAVATRLLATAGVLVAASSVFVLGVMAFTWVGQLPAVASLGEWSTAALRLADPIPDGLAAASAVLLLPAAVWWSIVAAGRARSLIAVHRRCRHLTAAGALIVVHDQRPEAFTTPQPAGRIVVTTGLLKALSTQERRVLLAHEGSHLRHRHAWWVLAADLAAAANPMLRPTARTVARAVERWADEDAATTVADRKAAARALARTALLIHNPATAEGLALGATSGEVPDRVRALMRPAPSPRPASVAALSVLLLVLTAATLVVQHRGEQLFEHAGRHLVTTAAHRPDDASGRPVLLVHEPAR